MTTPPKDPSAIGGQYEHVRRTARYNRQRMAGNGAGGSLTTLGFIPARPKRQLGGGSGTVNKQVWL